MPNEIHVPTPVIFSGCEYGDRDDCSALLARSCYDVTYRTSKCCKTCENLKRSDLPESKFSDRT